MAHSVTFGLRYHEDEVDRFQPIDNFTQSVSSGGRPTLEYVSTTQPTGGNNRVEEAEAWSAFIADRVAVTDCLELTGLLGGVHRGMSPAGAIDTDVDPEISVNYEMPLASGLSLPVSATWTYTDAEITQDSDDGSVFSGDNLAYLPEHGRIR